MSNAITLLPLAGSGFTVIPNLFFDAYLARANGEFLKIYLYLYRRLGSDPSQLEIEQLADIFNLTEKDVIRAIRYWENEGLLTAVRDEQGFIRSISLSSILSAAPAATVQSEATSFAAAPLSAHALSAAAVQASASSPAFTVPSADDPASLAAPAAFGGGVIAADTESAVRSSQDMAASVNQDDRDAVSFENRGSASAGQSMSRSASDAAFSGTAAAAAASEAEGSITPSDQPDPTASSQRNQIPDYSMDTLMTMASSEEGSEFIKVIQFYLGHPLSSTDLNVIYYIHEDLGFSFALMEHLFEYCVSLGKRKMSYIQAVALSWHEKGITTPEQARENCENHNKDCYAVLKAFGLSNRNPVQSEIDYVERWTKAFGFSMEMVLDACGRTMKNLHTPSFEYTDSILLKWKKKGITTMAQIAEDDLRHAAAAQETRSVKTQIQTRQTSQAGQTANRFHNFKQRSYEYGELEQAMLRKLQEQRQGPGMPSESNRP